MSGDVRSNSMIYEEMSAQTQPTNVEDYNAYDYAIGHVWACVAMPMESRDVYKKWSREVSTTNRTELVIVWRILNHYNQLKMVKTT